jgi:hypothetical protein
MNLTGAALLGKPNMQTKGGLRPVPPAIVAPVVTVLLVAE